MTKRSLLAFTMGLMLTASPASAQLGSATTFDQVKRSIFQVAGTSTFVSPGTAFVVRSSNSESDLLTASHVVHPGASVLPGGAGCAAVSYHAGPPPPGTDITVRSTFFAVPASATITILADDYCRDLALIAITSGPYPAVCFWLAQRYAITDHQSDAVLIAGFLPPFGSSSITPVPSAISSPADPGYFRITTPVDPGYSGSPVVEISSGLVIGIIERAENGTIFTLAHDPQALENFLMPRIPVRWISNPANQSMRDCRGL
jgi:hypothetical protein